MDYSTLSFGLLDFVQTGFTLIFLVTLFASMWKVFEKAGIVGWKSLVPLYNVYLLTVIARLPWWYFLLIFIPGLGIIIAVYIYYKVAENFGKGMVYALGLIFLPFIFWPMLAFGDSVYVADGTGEVVTPIPEDSMPVVDTVESSVIAPIAQVSPVPGNETPTAS